MPKITDLFIKNAQQGIYWDTNLPSFGIRVGKKRKSFIVLVASGRRKSIGHYPLMSLADARKSARELLAEKILGKVHPNHFAFDDAKRQYLEECATKNRPITVNDYTKILTRHYPFGRKNIADITPQQILKQIRQLDDKPTRKRYAFATGRAFFNWCVQQHIIQFSPMASLTSPQAPRSRDRVLSRYELICVWKTAKKCTTTFHKIVALLVLMGQRRNETAHLEWEWITDTDITVPWTITKNKRVNVIPLTPQIEAVIDTIPNIDDCPYLFPAARIISDKTTVFNGWGKSKEAFDKECGVTDWKLHDLRRVLSSYWAEMGIDQIIVEKVLNHVSGGTQSQIAQVYNRYEYREEKYEALLKWHHYLDTLTTAEAIV